MVGSFKHGRPGFPPLEVQALEVLIDPRRFFDERLTLTEEERDLLELEIQQVLELHSHPEWLSPHARSEWERFWAPLEVSLEEALQLGLDLIVASRTSGNPIEFEM